MFSKFVTFATLSLALAAQVSAHCAVAPVLGVKGAPARSDVQRPSTASPCGSANIAAALGKSTVVAAAADGTFTTTATNFNGGRDGSRQMTATVDATATGKNFVAAKVTQNGDLAPTNVGSQKLITALPAGTKCTGGASKNLCLVSFKSAGGFGNCVVVSQGAAKREPVGTRAPRAVLQEMEARGEEVIRAAKRNIVSWIWA